ncbi:urea ABC transporter permease subunit UrtB [Halotalea alkalilenta]|uniref:Urea ABC transporter permease subunit UrtB n=1 Tax=Halotalea alkalilenta TaxID=376489 RepID=A0A172YJ21_9GAMM|nr:urea ABC transporter permease subunit UrtB [Halotalea alkalilenta]
MKLFPLPLFASSGARLFALLGLCACLMVVILGQQAHAQSPDDAALLESLGTGSFNDKSEAINSVAASGTPRAGEWLEAMLDGRLQLAGDGTLVIVASTSGRSLEARAALDGAPMGTIERRELRRIPINNALRVQLRGAIATLDLSAEDPAVRRAAAAGLFGRVDDDLASLIEARLEGEEDESVRAALERALALPRLEHGDVTAIEALRGSQDNAVRLALTRAAQSGDAQMAAAAQQALGEIERRAEINRWLQQLFFGLSMGSVLVLAAIGLAITFGVMGVINMAHGELIMLGAYTTWMLQQWLPGQPGLAVLLAIPAGFLVSALVGIVLERGVIRYLKGRPLETLLATFGVSLILQQLVRTMISPQNRSVVTPEWMSGSVMVIDGLSLTLNRLYVMLFAALVFLALLAVMRATRLGLEVRAVTQNRAMARAMGIRASRVDLLTFALGSGVAGLAGVALSQLTNVGPSMGQNYIIDSFMVVVFGGVGNLWGTLVAGLSLGIVNQWLEPWVGAVLAKIAVLVFIILFIQKRPRGLFPQKGRAAEG